MTGLPVLGEQNNLFNLYLLFIYFINIMDDKSITHYK